MYITGITLDISIELVCARNAAGLLCQLRLRIRSNRGQSCSCILSLMSVQVYAANHKPVCALCVCPAAVVRLQPRAWAKV